MRLGHWSFALYLVHDVVIRLVLAVAGRPAGIWERAAVWIVVAFVSQGLAAVLYTRVEHPAERYLRGRVTVAPAAVTASPPA